MGIINAGTAVGAVIAPPLIAIILSYSSWRWIFVVTGGLGLIWAWWWIKSYFSPRIDPALSLEERNQFDFQLFAFPRRRRAGSICFGFASRWGLVSAKFLSDAAWYFYLFWLPKYLYDARGFDVKAVGHLRLDSLRRGRDWLPSGRLVFKLSA